MIQGKRDIGGRVNEVLLLVFFYHLYEADNFYDFLFAFLHTKSLLKRSVL